MSRARQQQQGLAAVLVRRAVQIAPHSNVLVATVLAVAVALAISMALISSVGQSPLNAMHAVYLGSLASTQAWSLTLLYVAPLLLVAVGSCICMRGGVFNIGQEGQVLLGALAATWVALRMPITGPALMLVTVLAAVVAGALWASVSSLMYWWRGVNIVVSTLLMTFVAAQIIGYAVSKDWLLQATRMGDSIVESQSDQLPEDARLGSIGQYPSLEVNMSLIIALLLTAVIAVLLMRSRWGIQIKMLGLSPSAARHSGVRTTRMSTWALALSGGFAGLAGAVLVASPVGTNRLQSGTANNIGWDGLLIVLVARSNPLVAIPVALLFGVLRAGGGFLASAGVPSALVDVMKALLVLAFVVPPIIVSWYERRMWRNRQQILARSLGHEAEADVELERASR